MPILTQPGLAQPILDCSNPAYLRPTFPSLSWPNLAHYPAWLSPAYPGQT